MPEETSESVKLAVRRFLLSLDANDRTNLKEIVMAAWDNYVTVPGPDKLIKKQLRPSVEKSVDNVINDLLSW